MLSLDTTFTIPSEVHDAVLRELKKANPDAPKTPLETLIAIVRHNSLLCALEEDENADGLEIGMGEEWESFLSGDLTPLRALLGLLGVPESMMEPTEETLQTMAMDSDPDELNEARERLELETRDDDEED